MKLKYIILSLITLLIVACGPKVNSDAYIKSTDVYASEINVNTALKETLTKGALTDKTGSKDIGVFTYQEKFSQDNGELFHIKNIEKTDKTLTENYYFKGDSLVLITSTSHSGDTKKLYIKNDKVVSRVNIGKAQEKILLNKAKLFKKQFKSAH